MRDGFLLIAVASALLAGCATVTNPVTGQREISVMDERSEIAEGRKAHEQVLQEFGAYANPRLQAYVNELGQRLAKQSHRKNLEWHFTVLDSPEINAFALPGGYVYVTRGLMAYMESEADLAGVIGHEIGHVTARHGAQRATRQQTTGLRIVRIRPPLDEWIGTFARAGIREKTTEPLTWLSQPQKCSRFKSL